jgi:hypothetical protein
MIQSQTFRCHQMSLSTTLKFGGRRSSYDSQQPCKTENSQGQTVEQSAQPIWQPLLAVLVIFDRMRQHLYL